MITLISIIIVVALYMMLGIAVIAMALMLSLFLAIGCALAKRKIAKSKPSERVCPMCGSQRIKFKYMSSEQLLREVLQKWLMLDLHREKRKFSVKIWHTAKIADSLLISPRKKTSTTSIKSSITGRLVL